MKVPNHIAIILDGNGRWAKAKGMPRGYGHIKGCANLEYICDDIKVFVVLFLFFFFFFPQRTGNVPEKNLRD